MGCSGGSSSGASSGGSSSSTWTLSGSISGVGASVNPMSIQSNLDAEDYALYYSNEAMNAIRGNDEVHSMATQCGDGYYYRVRCLSWSASTTVEADVSCSGSSGSFSVPGLPTNDDISCFVRKSSDNSTFKPFATMEISAATMAGTTDTLKTSGDMTVTVAVTSTGTVTTAVTSGTNSTSSSGSTSTSTPTTYNGYYNLSCTGITDTTMKKRCKCFFFGDQSSYNSGNSDPSVACMADTVSNVDTAIPDSSKMTINLNVYNATVQSPGIDFNGDSTIDAAEGSTIQGVSIWGASNGGSPCTTAGSCSTSRGSGGEGASTMGGLLSFASSQATNAIAWVTSNQTVSSVSQCTSSTCTLAFSTNPVPDHLTATKTDWLNWLKALYIASSFSCSGGNTDAYCLGNFIYQAYQKSAESMSINLPRVRWEPGNSGCSVSGCTTPTSAISMLRIEGIEFNNDATGTVKVGGIGPSPRGRFVFEQWIPNSAGGGKFRQHEDDRRWITCLSGSGTDSSQGIYGCPDVGSVSGGTYQGVECMMSSEMTINFGALSGSTASVGFNKVSTVKMGIIRGGASNGLTKTSGGFDATAKCLSVYGSSGGDFTATATKL